MSKLIDLVVTASALIVLISAGLSHVNGDKRLEQELNEAAAKGADEVERILNGLSPWEKENIRIDNLSVNQILRYKQATCKKIIDLLALRRMIGNQTPPKNKGVFTFIDNYIPERLESCKSTFFGLLKKTVESFPLDTEEFVESLSDTDEGDGLSRCKPLMCNLSELMWFVKWIPKEQDKDDLKLLNKWFNIFEACKKYSKRKLLKDHKWLPSCTEKYLSPMERPQILQ